MKKYWKRITGVVLCAALIISACLVFGGSSAYAYTSLPYIEELVSTKTGNSSFNILEIVPADASGSIGYYIQGSEPFANQQAALSPLESKAQRESYAITLFDMLSSRGLISNGKDTPLSYSGEKYVELKPWEMAPGDYVSMRRLSLLEAESENVNGRFSLQIGGGYREIVEYNPAIGDRVQIIDFFVPLSSLENTSGYYFYNPVFSKISSGATDIPNGTAVYTNTATDGFDSAGNAASEELDKNVEPLAGGYQYFDTWSDSIELNSQYNYYYVTSTGAPSLSPDEASGAIYAAISNDYRLVQSGEIGYFVFTAYEYVGLGSGSYAYSPEGTESFLVYYNTVYYNLGYSNNNWFLRYVMDRDDSYFSGSSKVNLNVVSMRADLVTRTMVQNADLIVLSSGMSLSGSSLASYYVPGSIDLTSDAQEYISAAAANAVPVIVDYSLTQLSVSGALNIRTLAQMLCSGFNDSDFNFVNGNIYSYTGALASSALNTAVSPSSGFEKIIEELDNENFLRKQADTNTKDILPVIATPGTAIRYVINYQKHRIVETKDTISVLELQPGNVTSAHKLTADTVRGWLGNPSELKNIYIDTFPIQEFIGKIDDLVENYDLIYIGDSTDGFNVTNSSTVYNDTGMNGLLYSNIGDLYHSNMALSGLLDSDFIDSGKTVLNGTSGTTANLFRFSGNDLTRAKANELISFAQAGYPIVCADDLVQTGTSKIEVLDFTVALSPIVDNNKAYFTAKITCEDTIPSGSTITYQLYSVNDRVNDTLIETVEAGSSQTTKTFAYGASTAGSYYCKVSIVDKSTSGSTTPALSNYVTVSLSTSSITPSYPSEGGSYNIISANINYDRENRYFYASLSNSNGELPNGINITKYQWQYKSNNGDNYSNTGGNNWQLNDRRTGYYRCQITFTYAGNSYTLVTDTIRIKNNGQIEPIDNTNDNNYLPIIVSSDYTVTIAEEVSGSNISFGSTVSGNPYRIDYQWTYYNGTYTDAAHFQDIDNANDDEYSVLLSQNGTVCYRLEATIWPTHKSMPIVVYSNVIQFIKSGSGNSAGTVIADALPGGTSGSFPITKSVTAGVNDARVDKASYMYYMLDSVRNYDNVFTVNDTESMSTTLLRYLNLSKPSIVWTDPKISTTDFDYSYPVEYKLNSDGTMSGLSATGGKYYLIYTFSISNETDPTPGATSYNCKLFIDLNSDGLYRSDEEIKDIVIRNSATNALITPVKDGEISYYTLKADVNYTLTRQMPDDYAGIIPWKLSVIKNGTSSYIHASETNYTHITPTAEQITTLNILQICSNSSGRINLQEQLAVNSSGTNSQLRGKDGKYYTGIYGKLIADIDDFDVKITSNTIDEMKGYSTEKAVYDYLRTFDMLIIGFDDMYGTLSTDTANAIMKYIADGDTSVLFTHDTTSLSNLEDGGSTLVRNDSRNITVGSMGGPDFWGYSFNSILRSAVSLDRYGISSKELISGTNQTISSVLSASSLSSSNISDVLNKGYSVAYEPHSNSVISSRTQGYNNYSLIRYSTKSSEYKPTTSSYSSRETTCISQVNKGQITTYPYDINTYGFGGTDSTISSSKYMSIGNTHEQYYQLNLNSDNIVVWYCLSGAGNINSYYSDVPNDVLNSYYIYSKGNITYSGVGHTYNQSNYTGSSIGTEYINEAKLFVNTMIAAYRTVVSTPTIAFTSSSSGVDNLDYFFVTSDYTVSGNSLTTTGDILSGDYKLYFRLTDPSLYAKKLISLNFYYAPVKNGEEISGAGSSFSPVVLNADSGSQVSSYSGGLVYYINLPQSVINSLVVDYDNDGAPDYDSVRIYAVVSTSITTYSNQDFIEIRRIGLFSLN